MSDLEKLDAAISWAIMNGLAQKTLTQCLRRSERNGIIERRLIDGAPPGVEYRVTDLGRTLDKPFGAMRACMPDSVSVRSVA
jgi:DNA-binding HxlR family transcriptional regulator